VSVIRSRDNERVKRWTKLVRDARLRRKEGRLLVEGPHLVQAALQAGIRPHAFLVSESGMARGEIASLASQPVVIADRVFAGVVDAETPPGIAAEIALPAERDEPGDAVFLEGVQDPGNVGAIIRSAAAFGIQAVVLDGACADPWSPKALRAGMGGHFRLSIDSAFAERIRAFKGTLACTVVKGGTPLGELPSPVGWIFGGEGQGISEATAKLAKRKVTIPMAAGTESLNVAVAAAICFYEAFSRRGGRS
jgi:RNA methyltransferase, TrmH family